MVVNKSVLYTIDLYYSNASAVERHVVIVNRHVAHVPAVLAEAGAGGRLPEDGVAKALRGDLHL